MGNPDNSAGHDSDEAVKQAKALEYAARKNLASKTEVYVQNPDEVDLAARAKAIADEMLRRKQQVG